MSGDSHAITVPLFKSLAAPLRRVRVTVPWVVGFQVKVAGWPAVTEKLLDTVGGFAVEPPDCATATAIRLVTVERIERRMLMASILFCQANRERRLGYLKILRREQNVIRKNIDITELNLSLMKVTM